MPDIEVVSWDVDGTLYPMTRFRFELFRLAVENLLTGRSSAKHIRAELKVLRHIRKYVADLRATGGVLVNPGPLAGRAVSLRIEEKWYGEAIRRSGVSRLAARLLHRFDSAGLRQIVVSDYLSSYKLKILGLEGKFDAVYAGEELGLFKPNPELFLKVAQDLGVDPGRILHIGDIVSRDAAAASGAGLQTAIIGRDDQLLNRFLDGSVDSWKLVQ